MSEHNLFYYPYASFTNAQLSLLKVAALYFDKLVILDPVGANWDVGGADYVARDAMRLLRDAGILEIVTPATVLAKYDTQIAEAIRRDMHDRESSLRCSLRVALGEMETETHAFDRAAPGGYDIRWIPREMKRDFSPRGSLNVKG